MDISQITQQHKENIPYSINDYLSIEGLNEKYFCDKLYYSQDSGKFIVECMTETKPYNRLYLSGTPDFYTTYAPYLHEIEEDILTSDYILIHQYN